MPSITNLRNLGGFYNQKRELIKPGLVFRSGQLYDLTTEQIQYLSETLKITRIVDMRSTAEQKQFPDVVWPQAQYTTINILEHASENIASLQSMISNSDDVKSRMLSLYEQLAIDPIACQRYHQFIKLLLVPNQSLIFHCFAGKDRTGVGAALFLKILSVSDEQIMNDYLQTNQMRTVANKKILEKISDKLTKDQQKRVAQALLVDSDYLIHYFETIKSHYASFDSYLKNALKLTSSDLQKLKKNYLIGSSL